MPTYTGARAKAGQHAAFLFGDETGRLLPHHEIADISANAPLPEFNMVGYADVPGIEENENVQLIESVGSYQGVDAIPGRREYAFNGNVRVGSTSFVARAIRGSDQEEGYAGERYRCLPMIAMAGGAFYPACDGGTDDESYLWIARQGFIQDIRFQFGEGQPVVASVSAVPLYVEEYLAEDSVVDDLAADYTQANLIAAAGKTLTWQNMDWSIGSTSYRPILAGVSIGIQNNIQRWGMRKLVLDGGNETTLSRVPYGIIPLGERLSVEYQLHDKIPTSLRRDDIDWGAVTVEAEDPISGKLLRLTINNNMMTRHAQGGTQPNSMLSFSCSTVSRGLSVTIA